MKIGQRTKAEKRGRSSAATAGPAATDQRILEYARRAFNERGVGAVGIREIARDLGLSPGNVSYHFATKEALIAAMIREGHTANNATLHPPRPVRDFEELYAALCVVMRRDVDHRWLLRDYAGLLVAMPALRELHDQLQGPREARVESVIADLLAANLLDAEKTKPRLEELRRQIFTQVFFWLPSAVISAPDVDPLEGLDAFARAVVALFLPYCTAAGRRQLESLLDRR